MDKKIFCVVIAVIRNDKGEFLLSNRIDPDISEADGTWDFVGGKLEFGEKLEQALVREAKEESGLDIRILKLVPYVASEIWSKKDNSKIQTVLISYDCKVTGGQLHTENFDPKIKALKFVAFEDFNNYRLLSNVLEIAEAAMKS